MKRSGNSCQFISKWGRCSQRQYSEKLCSYHWGATMIEDFRHDGYYHRKIVEGITSSSHDVLGKTEVDALFKGRTRNDGRRTDLYPIL